MNDQQMLNSTRQQKLGTLLRQRGELRLRDIIAEFGVARATAQRDLDLLSQQTWVKRTHGGVVLAERGVEYAAIRLSDRMHTTSEEKRTIAHIAVGLLDQGASSLYVDAGTTTIAFTKELILASLRPVWVVTNCWHVAEQLSLAGIRHELLGGEVDSRSLAISGPTALNSVRDYHFDWAILSADAVTETGSVRVARPPEALLKRAAAQSSTHTILLADAGKFGRDSHIEALSLGDVDVWVAERSDEAMQQICTANDVRLVTSKD